MGWRETDSARQMAQEHGVNEKAFRKALRADRAIDWHPRFAIWNPENDQQYQDMLRVLTSIK